MKKIFILLFVTLIFSFSYGYTPNQNLSIKLNDLGKKIDKCIRSDFSKVGFFQNQVKVLKSKYKNSDKAKYILNYVEYQIINSKKLTDHYLRVKNTYSGVDLNSFEMLINPYSKDKNYVYYDNKILDQVDPNSFQIINAKLGKDKNYVYFIGSKIDGADPDSFQNINNLYFKDKYHIFRDTYILTGADVKTFQALDYYIGKDKNHVYKENEILEGADAATFESVSLSDDLRKDKNKEYDFYHYPLDFTGSNE